MRQLTRLLTGLALTAALTTGAAGSAAAADNQAPTITAPAEVVTPRSTAYQFRGAISIADPDAGSEQLKVRLSVPEAWWGDFTLPERTGLTFTRGDGTADHQVEFLGSADALNAALAELEFMPGFSEGGYETFQIAVDDLGNSGDGGARTATASVGVYIGSSNPRITVASPAPHTPVNTPYVSNGRFLTVAEADGDEIDVRITLDRGTITLGAAPDADVIDAGGDRDARVVGTAAEVKPALDGIVITPDTDDQREIIGAVWVYQNEWQVAGQSLHLIVDDGAIPGTCTPGADSGPGANQAPTITAPASVVVAAGVPYQFGGAIAVADPDAGSGQLKVRLSVPSSYYGDFTLHQRGGLSFTRGDGITDYDVEFCGAPAAVNAALAEAEFATSLANGGTAFSLSVDDLGNSGSGGARRASATVGVYIGGSRPQVIMTYPSPRTPLGTPYAADGTWFTVEEADGDEIDVRITLDRGTITLGAAPDADVIDAGGDRDARVVGTAAEVKSALDGLVITPDAGDAQTIYGSLWVVQNGSTVAGHSLELFVDEATPGDTDQPREPVNADDPERLPGTRDDHRAPDRAPAREDDRATARATVTPHPLARASAVRAGQRVKLSARGSRARGSWIVSYRWTTRDGRVISRKPTFWLKVAKRTKVTLTVVSGNGRTARAALVVKPAVRRAAR